MLHQLRRVGCSPRVAQPRVAQPASHASICLPRIFASSRTAKSLGSPTFGGRLGTTSTKQCSLREDTVSFARTMIALQAWTRGLLVLPLVMCTLSIAIFPAHAQEPIKIGFSVSLTGGLASSGKAHLMSKQIWAEEINAKGGLLGRPVKLVYYDDQTNASTVPGIYAKLIDVDKVDLLMGARHQSDRRRDAAHHRAQEDGHGAARARLQCRVQVSALFPERAVRARLQGRAVEQLLRGGKVAQAGAEDRGAGRRRRRVLQQRADRRARERQEIRPQDRLRPHLSAGDRRLHADRARHPGDQSRPGPARILSAGLGRHGARRDRNRSEDPAVRRRHGRECNMPR